MTTVWMTAIRHSPGLRNITVAWHETLIGRARGRALAHEVGHYLLRSKLHTLRGLMRAVLSGDEFLALIRDGFELTPVQSLAAARLRMEYQPATAAWRYPLGHVRETIDRVHSIHTNDCSLSRILPDATHRYRAPIVGRLARRGDDDESRSESRIIDRRLRNTSNCTGDIAQEGTPRG